MIEVRAFANLQKKGNTVATPDYCHFGDRCFQVHCFGKSRSSYVSGSKVQLFQSPNDLTAWRKFDETEKLRAAFRRHQGYADPMDSLLDSLRGEDSDPSTLSSDGRDSLPDNENAEPEMDREQIPFTPWDDILSDLWERIHSGERSGLASYQIITQDSESIIVLNGHLSHWQVAPMEGLPILGGRGEPTMDPGEGAWPWSFREGEYPCDVCLILRGEGDSGATLETGG
jgi:hypothetical protein